MYTYRQQMVAISFFVLLLALLGLVTAVYTMSRNTGYPADDFLMWQVNQKGFLDITILGISLEAKVPELNLKANLPQEKLARLPQALAESLVKLFTDIKELGEKGFSWTKEILVDKLQDIR